MRVLNRRIVVGLIENFEVIRPVQTQKRHVHILTLQFNIHTLQQLVRVLTRNLPAWSTLVLSNWDYHKAIYSKIWLKIYIFMLTRFSWYKTQKTMRSTERSQNGSYSNNKRMVIFRMMRHTSNLMATSTNRIVAFREAIIQEWCFHDPYIHDGQQFGAHFRLAEWLNRCFF